MSESTQIVRPLRRGEFAPVYSTEELMRGVCHVVFDPFVRVAQPKKLERKKVSSHDIALHRNYILSSLNNNFSKRVISASLGIQQTYLSALVSNDSELRAAAVRIGSCMACDPHFDEIKRLVIAGKPTEMIAHEIGLSWTPVKAYIEAVHGLREIYHSFGNRKHNKASRDKWDKNRQVILEELKTQSVTSVRKKWGFRCDAFNKYLDEVKNGK